MDIEKNIIKNNLIAAGIHAMMCVIGTLTMSLVWVLAENIPIPGTGAVLIVVHTILIWVLYFLCGRFFIKVDSPSLLTKAISCVFVFITLMFFALFDRANGFSIFFIPFTYLFMGSGGMIVKCFGIAVITYLAVFFGIVSQKRPHLFKK